MTVPLPADLVRRYSDSAERRAWLARLPQLIQDALDRWQLRVDLSPGQEPWNGFSGIAIPVRTGDDRAAVLKITFPYEDIAHEAATLRLWNGVGAVRLLDNDEADFALLLERLDAARWLQAAPPDEAVRVWGALLRNLSIRPDDRPGWASLPSLAERAEHWSDELPAEWDRLGEPFPRWLLEAALEVCQTRGSVGRREANDVLVHGDMHGMNILAKPGTTGWEPEDFLVIDPQGILGEAEYAVGPMLSNRLRDYAAQNPELALLDRLHRLCAAAGLDPEIAREWTILREVEDALWFAAKPNHEKDLHRTLWIASTLAGSTLPGLPHPHGLEIL